MKLLLFKNVALLLCLSMVACTRVEVSNLLCERNENPYGIDVPHPRLSWELAGNKRGVCQKRYRILVASSWEKLKHNEGDLWDSGEVETDESVFIPYQGTPLTSRQECYWKVKVTMNDSTSLWSEPAMWTMGLLNADDWEAQWIGLDKTFDWEAPTQDNTRMSARYFRSEFDVKQKPEKATIYLSGLGLYKLYINGRKVGRQELSPTPTDYNKEVKYNTFDVTELLKKGENAIGIVLGNGRFFHMRRTGSFEYPKLIAQLEITSKDGSRQVVTSGAGWKATANGPIVANNEYDGEEYDARKEMPGWSETGFDDSQWLEAELVSPPKGELGAQLNKNITVMDSIAPVGLWKLKEGTYILDMGQNMVGWLRMKVKGEQGTQVSLRFAEFLNEDGTINQENLRGGLANDKYTLKGKGTEVWEPSFTSHGFRYVEITGYPGEPHKDDFEGRIVYDEMRRTGSFECSDSLLNRIYQNACWSIQGNYRGMPTDCPQRTERMGWTGDRAIGSYGESFVFDNNNLYAKWVNDIRVTQREDGSVSDIAPSYWSYYTDNMTWPGTYLIVSDVLYRQYGNMESIQKHYSSMKKWVYYMRDKYLNEEHIMPRDIYGDWCTPPEDPTFNDPKDPSLITDKELIGTAYYYHMLDLLAKFAGLLGYEDDIREYESQLPVVKAAYNNKFLNKERGYYSNNTVTANVLSLAFGLVPQAYRETVFENMIDRTVNEFDGHISTGVIGCQWLMRELTKGGRPDVALRMLQKTDYPSFGYMIKKGATTIWEHWNGDGMEKWIDSQNHVMMLGDLIIWLYENLAGIKSDESACGFKKIIMKPELTDELRHVKASYHSVRGLIRSSWESTDDAFRWDITIPCNATALVYLPAEELSDVSEGGKELDAVAGVTFVKKDGRYIVVELVSGDYAFMVKR